MEPNWASENLQVIRTLMERSAIYRRALAPVMILAGVMGVAGAIGGALGQVDSNQWFAAYWVIIALFVSGGAFLLIRRQALKESEPFWSLPTRRVAQAATPGFFVGGVLTILLALTNDSTADLWLPPVWMLLYGCALHSAGFFMPRGMRLFGWIFVISGVIAIVAGIWYASRVHSFAVASPSLTRVWGNFGHMLMGITFGGFHLLYGVYLYFTEPRKNAA